MWDKAPWWGGDPEQQQVELNPLMMWQNKMFLPLLFATSFGSSDRPWEFAATFKLSQHKPFSWVWSRKNG